MSYTNSTNYEPEIDLESVERKLRELAAMRATAPAPAPRPPSFFQRTLWRWFSLFVTLSVVVSFWLFYELGFIFSKRIEASEPQHTGLESLQRSVEEKAKALTEREEALNKREKSLADKEKILAEQLNRYEKSLSEIKGKLAEYEKMRDARVEAFRQVYEKMDPKKASKIMDEMDLGLASQILGGMKGDRAAEILGKMTSDKARQITEKSLGKRVVAGKESNENPITENSKGGEP